MSAVRKQKLKPLFHSFVRFKADRDNITGEWRSTIAVCVFASTVLKCKQQIFTACLLSDGLCARENVGICEHAYYLEHFQGIFEVQLDTVVNFWLYNYNYVYKYRVGPN